VFDRRLRLLVMDAVERIEVAVRSQLAFEHAHKYGDPFAYAETSTSLPNITSDRRSEFLGKIRTEKIRSHETFVRHFTNRYGDTHGYLPVWMAAEIMSFGGVLTFYNGCEEDIKQKLASTFGIPALVLGSWMLTLNTVRNICAHHGRLWNRVLGTTPLIPRVNRYPDWHRPYSVPNNRTFVVLTICRYSLGKVAPQSRWAERLKDLLNEFPDIPIRDMGFPENWIESPIWNNV
jgi:abortive infection bacteriophage resistance protein